MSLEEQLQQEVTKFNSKLINRIQKLKKRYEKSNRTNNGQYPRISR